MGLLFLSEQIRSVDDEDAHYADDQRGRRAHRVHKCSEEMKKRSPRAIDRKR